jgi:NACalpha-BTF3-like transcription factor
MGIYNDKPGVWSEDYNIYFTYKLDKKEIIYYSNQRIYFNNKAQEVQYNDIFLRIHFEDLSGCQITPHTDNFGMHYVELKLVSHNKCKIKWMQTKNGKDELKVTVDFDHEPDTDCSKADIKLFYRENLVSSDRIIKALQQLIILTGGTLEPF